MTVICIGGLIISPATIRTHRKVSAKGFPSAIVTSQIDTKDDIPDSIKVFLGKGR